MSTLFSIIAAIIHIGDIDFMEDYSDRHMAANSKVSNYQQMQISKWQKYKLNRTMYLVTETKKLKNTRTSSTCKTLRSSC